MITLVSRNFLVCLYFCNTVYILASVILAQCILDSRYHRRRKYGGSSPNSLRPISYFGSIWELYVLDLKTNVFCRKKIQLHFPMNKGLTVPKQCQQFGRKQPKCPPKFQPNLSAQAQKFRIFEKKLSLDVRCPWSRAKGRCMVMLPR